MKTTKRTTRKNTNKTIIAEIIIEFITVCAGLTLIFTVEGMIEAWSITTTPLIVAIICFVWLALFSLYVHLVNK